MVGVLTPDEAVLRRGLSTRPSDAVDGGRELLRERLVGREVGAPLRHGKRLAWPIGEWWLGLHLGMTGKWQRSANQPRFGRTGFVLDDGLELWFVDSRRFGCMTFVDDPDAMLTAGHGPDAMDEPMSATALEAAMATRRSPVKVVLMDQAVIAGLGNIHVAEALWRAQIHPSRPANGVTSEELRVLAPAIVEQLNAAVAAEEGQVIRYLGESGYRARPTDRRFVVYGRAGEPCARCGAEIERGKHSGRATFWCSACQR